MQGPRILILGGDADGNLGDRAILLSMLRAARESWPGADLSVVSADPARAAREMGVRALPRGLRGLPALLRAAARSDLVLVGGGGLFQDDDSLVKMPWWGLRVALVRLLCRRVVGYALGVGPLEARTSRLFARLAFFCMERVSVRDREARHVAQPLTRKEVTVVPDPALLLEPASREEARTLLAAQGVPLDGTPLLGVAPRRWFPPRPRLVPHRFAARFAKRPPESHRLTALLARALDRTVRETGAHVVFLPTYTLAHEGDDAVCAEIAGKMASPATSLLRLGDPRLYKAVAGELDALLAGRMHPGILAAGMGTPVVGLAYNPKFRGFFDLLGLEPPMEVERFVQEGEAQADELALRLVAAPAGARVGGTAPEPAVEAAASRGPRSTTRRGRLEELAAALTTFHRGLWGA